MYTVIDKLTGNEIRTHNMFRVGAPFPSVELGENEQLAYIPEILLTQLEVAYECVITIDAEGVATTISVTKSIEQWRQENQPILTLPEVQQQKILELNTSCNQTILGGFPSSCSGVEHQYKFDMEYQGNITQQGVMLTLDPTITVVMWPTSDTGVLPHTREQFIQLCKEAQDWKGTNIYRYFGLKAQVEACTEIEEVEALVWWS